MSNKPEMAPKSTAKQKPTQIPLAAPASAASRSPWVAGILSAILPGIGHIYAGKRLHGIAYLVMAAVMVGLLIWVPTTSEITVVPGLITVLIILAGLFWLWVLVSAVFAAGKRRFAPTLGLILVLLFTYLMGWQATDINLREFFTGVPSTFKLLTQVLWPWDAAVQREKTIVIGTTKFANPCPDNQADRPAQVEGGSGNPWVTVEPACGDFSHYDLQAGKLIPGTTLTVKGGGFEPNREVQIWWETAIGDQFQPRDRGKVVTTTADSQGNFSLTFGAPQIELSTQVGVQIHKVSGREVKAEGGLILTPEFSLAVSRMIVTIFQALMATSFGIVLAIPFSFLAARNLMFHSPITRAIYFAVRFVLNITRSIEPVIWAVVAAVWVGLGPFAGVIALTIHTVASLAKLYSEAIESIDAGPIEAVTATGANRIQSIMYAVIPQVIPPFLSFTIYRWDINVRMSTIIGFVGGGGIGQILFQWINMSLWSFAGIAVWLIAFTVSVMDYASAELRKRFV